jgi:hypothetical protein
MHSKALRDWSYTPIVLFCVTRQHHTHAQCVLTRTAQYAVVHPSFNTLYVRMYVPPPPPPRLPWRACLGLSCPSHCPCPPCQHPVCVTNTNCMCPPPYPRLPWRACLGLSCPSVWPRSRRQPTSWSCWSSTPGSTRCGVLKEAKLQSIAKAGILWWWGGASRGNGELSLGQGVLSVDFLKSCTALCGAAGAAPLAQPGVLQYKTFHKFAEAGMMGSGGQGGWGPTLGARVVDGNEGVVCVWRWWALCGAAPATPLA